MPTIMPQDVHIDAALSQLALEYRNSAFVSDIIFPRVFVEKQSDRYWIFDRERFRRRTTLRAPGAAAQQIAFKPSTDQYFADDHSLEAVIPDESRRNADSPIDPEINATESLTELLLLEKERALADLLTDTTKVTQNVTLAGTSQWSDFANSNPITDVETGKATIRQKAGRNPNVMVVGDPVHQKLINHPKIIERINFAGLKVANEEVLANVFGVERYLVASAIENIAAEGEPDNFQFVWGKHAVLLIVPAAARQQVLAGGLTFVWRAAEGSANGFVVEIGRAKPTSRKSDEIAVHFYYDQKITAVEGLYLIKNAVN